MTAKDIFPPYFSPSKMSLGPEKFKSLTHSHYSDSINIIVSFMEFLLTSI